MQKIIFVGSGLKPAPKKLYVARNDILKVGI